MPVNGPAKHYIIMGNSNRAIELGQAFVEPCGRQTDSIIGDQMSVLVKNNIEVVLLATCLRAQRNVVDVLTWLKIAGIVFIRLEWAIRSIVFENDNRSWNSGVCAWTREELSHHFAELLESCCQQTDVFLRAVADHEQVLGSNTDPLVTREGGRWPAPQGDENSQRIECNTLQHEFSDELEKGLTEETGRDYTRGSIGIVLEVISTANCGRLRTIDRRLGQTESIFNIHPLRNFLTVD
jgi:hypothetical protein